MKTSTQDYTDRYRAGLKSLLGKMDTSDALYAQVLTYESRLNENLARKAQYGDSEATRAERNEIISHLNDIAMTLTATSFNDLCQVAVLPDVPEPAPVAVPATLDLQLIPSGVFIMGSIPQLDPDAYEDEFPMHSLHLPDYYLSKTPVTNAQYAEFINATQHRAPTNWVNGYPPGYQDDHPVVNVSLIDAMAYCRWLSESTGKAYRLPTEAEWEKAARGEFARLYPWGYTWQPNLSNTKELGHGQTRPVTLVPSQPSPYGILDMGGNVYEWTSSLWGRKGDIQFNYPYRKNDGRETLEPLDSALCIVRGGSFLRTHRYARCASRDKCIPISKNPDLGFRIASDGG